MRISSAGVLAAAVVVAAAACSKTSDQKYSNAVDSGVVAPAARPDLSLTKNDTMGNAQRTGKPGVAGETLSVRGQPAGTGARRPDTTRKRP